MKKMKSKSVANVLSFTARLMLSSAANSRCAFVYHQPKLPKGLKRNRDSNYG